MTTVLVTGASGFIAKHIIRELLDGGSTVRAAVRSDRAEGQVRALFPDADLHFVRLDLNQDQGWSEAMTGVDVLMHTASPFPAAQPKDPQELIRPAVDGTLRAMRAAHEAGVNRVILTSSCAAIYRDSAKPPAEPSTRANWTDPEGPATTAYEASKTLAERAAWDFVAEHPEMQLTTINPGAVLGVPMDEHYGTSLAYVQRVLEGKDPAYPKVSMPMVDVRDVAIMHVRAMQLPETIGQRFPAVAGTESMVDLARALKAAYPDRKISTRTLPDAVVKLLGRFVPEVGTIARGLGRNNAVDGSDAPTVMGFTYVPATQSALASAAYLASRGAAA